MIEIRANIDPLVRYLASAARQVPFAISLAINRTLNDIQAAQRQEVQSRFQLRRPDFILRTIKIDAKDRATKTKLVGTVRIDPTRDFLAKFEAGGRKRPLRGAHLALPAGALVNTIVPKSKRPKAYGFIPHTTRSGKQQLKGGYRTFVIKTKRGTHVVLQRQGARVETRRLFPGGGVSTFRRARAGAGGSSLALLFTFESEVGIPPRLNFEKTARRVVAERWTPNFNEAMNFALRTAR